MKNVKILWKYGKKGVTALASLVALIFFTLFALSSLNTPFKIRLYTVMSGSMTPTIKAGSVVVSLPISSYTQGDIITFFKNNENLIPVTHRIIDAQYMDQRLVYLTKGDANESADLEVVKQENILGKTILVLPYLGFLLSFAKTTKGLVFLIVIPSTIIFYNEFLNLKKAIWEELGKRKNKKTAGWHRLEVNQVNLAFVLAFALGFTAVFLSGKIGKTQTNLIDIVRVEGLLAADQNPIPPILTFNLSDDKKTAEFSVNNLYPFIKLSYVLTYVSNGQNWGAIGSYTLTNQYQSKRIIDLATCSNGTCVFHPNPTDLKLTITLDDVNGQKKVLEANL